MTGLVDIYRLRHGEKVSALRLLAYVLFGYAVSGLFHPKAYVINTLIVLGGLLFASLLNDYYDYALLGERNAIGNVLLKGQAKKNIVPFLVLIPWLVALGLFFLLLKLPVTNLALLLLWASFLLSFVYAFPPFRLKERKVLGTVTPPLGIFILFFEGLTLLAMPNMFGWMMAVIVFLFAWYLEFLHLVDDSLQRHETIKISTGRAMRRLKATALFGVMVSAFFVVRHPLFVVSLAGWFLRFCAVYRIIPQKVLVARRNVFSSVWRLEEFVIYAVVGIVKMFSSTL